MARRDCRNIVLRAGQKRRARRQGTESHQYFVPACALSSIGTKHDEIAEQDGEYSLAFQFMRRSAMSEAASM